MPEEKDHIPDLTERIAEAKERHKEPDQKQSTPAGDAFKVGSEIVGGVAAGTILGYFFDKWFNTSPLFFIVFFFFGVAGGFYNIYRLAQNPKIDDKDAPKE